METSQKRNVFFKAVEALVTISASIVQLSLITRSLDSPVVGQYQLILAWLFIVSALSCSGGISLVCARELTACSEAEKREVFSSALALQAAIVGLLLPALLLVFNQLSHFGNLYLPLSIGTVTFLCFTLPQLSQSLLLSSQAIGSIVSSSVLSQLVTTAVLFFLIQYSAVELTILIWAWAFQQALLGALLLIRAQAWTMFSFQSIRKAWLIKIAADVAPVLVMAVATHLYVRIDVLMLEQFTDSATLAHYSAAYLFLDQLMILSNFMITALFPNFARLTVAGGEAFQNLYNGILKILVKYLFPLACLIALFSELLLSLTFGEEYAVAWPSLSILMLAAMCAWLNGPSGTIFISLKKQSLYMWATIGSLAVNVIGNLILIPLRGSEGAAIATVLTELGLCLFSLTWIHRNLNYVPRLWFRTGHTS